MKINMHIGTPKLNPVAAVSPIKQNNQQNASGQQDKLTVGQQARNLFKGQQEKTNLIENLLKQRESIQEMKQKLTDRTLESGQGLSTIKDQLKEYDQQIEEINAQITKEQQAEIEQMKEKQEEAAKKKETKNETESLIDKSASLEQVKNLDKVKQSLVRERKVLENEVKLDAKRGVFSELKQKRLSQLNEGIQKADAHTAEILEKSNEQQDTEIKSETAFQEEEQ